MLWLNTMEILEYEPPNVHRDPSPGYGAIAWLWFQVLFHSEMVQFSTSNLAILENNRSASDEQSGFFCLLAA